MNHQKIALRSAIRERLSSMDVSDRRVESNNIIRALERSLCPSSSHFFAVYIPYTDEPDIRPFIDLLFERQIPVAFPTVFQNKLRMCQLTDLSTIIRNPITRLFEAKNTVWIDESSLTHAIIPGRAFTKKGERMGRGNGGYDYWISFQRKRSPVTQMIGVCFDCQIVHDIPMEKHDECVDVLVSPSFTSLV